MGGVTTYIATTKLSKEENITLINTLNALPLTATYESKNGHTIVLSHAGFNPDIPESERDYLWDRSHFTFPWNPAHDNLILVHGHTPVRHLIKQFEFWDTQLNSNSKQMAVYADGHKIDIDIGAVLNDAAVMLDLDTLEPTYVTT